MGLQFGSALQHESVCFDILQDSEAADVITRAKNSAALEKHLADYNDRLAELEETLDGMSVVPARIFEFG